MIKQHLLHTGNMPWDNIFDDLRKDYVKPRIVRAIYKAKMIPVKVFKELWNGEIIEEKID